MPGCLLRVGPEVAQDKDGGLVDVSSKGGQCRVKLVALDAYNDDVVVVLGGNVGPQSDRKAFVYQRSARV